MVARALRHFCCRRTASRISFTGFAIAVTFGASACAGDFGRPRYPWAESLRGAVAAPPEYTAGIRPSPFPLTEEEKQLRKFADRLLVPATDQELGFAYAPGADYTSYAAFLLDTPFRSATARYSRLIDDIRNDIQRIDPFFMLARQVADLDQKRERSIPHVSIITGGEVASARLRVQENIAVMMTVHAALEERIRSYRFALERLVIALPSPMAAEVERILGELARRVTDIRVIASPIALVQPTAPRATPISK
jgi:hypothetical protein